MSLRILKLFSVLAVLLSSLPALAGERMLLWGIYDGCERVPEFDRLLDKHLTKASVNSWVLAAPPSACQGEACAERAQAGCGLSDGLILGGRIWRSKVAFRVRLWLHDLAGHKTAYEDEYCQDCDVNQLLVEVTERIRRQPKFGVAAGAEPAYCAVATSEVRPDPRRSKLYFVAYGDGKGRAQVQAGVKDMLGDTLRPVHPVSGEKKQYSHDDLMHILGQQKEGQVLGVELYKEGGAQVWLFDGLTEHLASQEVKCKECKTEDLIESIRSTLPALWGHCFDTQCSLSVGRPPSNTEACEPTKELTCNEAPLSPGPSGVGSRSAPPAGIDPTVAKAVKALTWGIFAASTATAIGLFVANETSAGTVNLSGGASIEGALWRPAWTAAGLSAGMLAISIPITILMDRAQKREVVGGSAVAADRSSLLKCPR